MPSPEPDQYGRYRVRRKGDRSSPQWSTRRYDPERHVIVPGRASDTYGAAWPPKPHRVWEDPDAQSPQPDADNQPADDDTTNPDEETP